MNLLRFLHPREGCEDLRGVICGQMRVGWGASAFVQSGGPHKN
jgi:hypothetical protein